MPSCEAYLLAHISRWGRNKVAEYRRWSHLSETSELLMCPLQAPAPWRHVLDTVAHKMMYAAAFLPPRSGGWGPCPRIEPHAAPAPRIAAPFPPLPPHKPSSSFEDHKVYGSCNPQPFCRGWGPYPRTVSWRDGFCSQRRSLCVECGRPSRYVFAITGERLCDKCEHASPKYALVTALEASQHYGLNSVAGLPSVLSCNARRVADAAARFSSL